MIKVIGFLVFCALAYGVTIWEWHRGNYCSVNQGAHHWVTLEGTESHWFGPIIQCTACRKST